MILHYELRPLRWLPTLGQCIGIVNFVLVGWLLSFLPGVHLNLVVEACLYVFLAWWVVLYLTLALSSAKKSKVALFHTSLPGIWLGPGVTLALARSPLFILAGSFFLVCAAYLLVEDLLSERWTAGRVSTQPTRRWGMLAALSLQASWVLYITGRPRVSLFLAIAATGIIAAAMVVFGAKAQRSPRPRSIAAVVISIFAAIALAAVGMLDTTGRSTRPLAFTIALLDRLTEDAFPSLPESYAVSTLYQPPNIALGSGGVPGVVLRPKHKDDPPIAIPKPASLTLSSSRKDPVRIPFTGDYALYQDPLQAPPRNAPVLTGDPFSLSFRTRDVHLFMEATQQFGRTLDLNCCSRVDLEIRNQNPVANEYLELILIDGFGREAQSLGMARTVHAVETLAFRIPTPARIRHFDSLQVKFHRGLFQRQSSRIAIDGIVLVP